MRKILLKALFCTSALAIPQTTLAQELEAKVVINRAQVSDTKGDVFESLEKKLTDFLTVILLRNGINDFSRHNAPPS